MTPGERIKKLREAEGLSQPQLAKLLSSNRATIAGWETGINYPSLPSLVKLAHLFNVSIDYIAGIKNEDTLRLDNLDPKSRRAVRELVRCMEYRSRISKE